LLEVVVAVRMAPLVALVVEVVLVGWLFRLFLVHLLEQHTQLLLVVAALLVLALTVLTVETQVSLVELLL
jgi:hypothetical protein